MQDHWLSCHKIWHSVTKHAGLLQALLTIRQAQQMSWTQRWFHCAQQRLNSGLNRTKLAVFRTEHFPSAGHAKINYLKDCSKSSEYQHTTTMNCTPLWHSFYVARRTKNKSIQILNCALEAHCSDLPCAPEDLYFQDSSLGLDWAGKNICRSQGDPKPAPMNEFCQHFAPPPYRMNFERWT